MAAAWHISWNSKARKYGFHVAGGYYGNCKSLIQAGEYFGICACRRIAPACASDRISGATGNPGESVSKLVGRQRDGSSQEWKIAVHFPMTSCVHVLDEEGFIILFHEIHA
jgi:hypothetical protein